LNDFAIEVFDQVPKRQHGVRLDLLGPDVVGDFSAWVCAEYAGLVHMAVEDVRGLLRRRDECLHILRVTAWLSA